MSWNTTASATEALSGLQVLVVEDEPLIALELETILEHQGAHVVGPSSDIKESLRLARDRALSAALLDVRLGPQTVAPVARLLEGRGIPFLFYSGQNDNDEVRKRWPKAGFIAKPAPAQALISALASLARPAA